MAAKLIFMVGVLGVGGYVGRTVMNHDPSVISMTREQIETKLVDARTSLSRRDGPGEISIWSTGRTASGVGLAMRYSAESPILNCKAVITETAPGKSRVAADCGGTDTKSAISNTTAASRAPMFDEHIQATLAGRAFDRRNVDTKEMAVVFGGIGGMNQEAMRMAEEEQYKVESARAAR